MDDSSTKPRDLHSSSGPLDLGEPVAPAGGEGTVYRTSRSDVVAKVFTKSTRARMAKLAAMLREPPTKTAFRSSVAWPIDLIRDERGRVVGYLMDHVEGISLATLCVPQGRLNQAPGMTWYHIHALGVNVAEVIAEVHGLGHVVGDLREKNILTNARSLVTLIDCDSFQITEQATGKTHFCTVGTPDFTAPELLGLGESLKTTARSPTSDSFALAILLFKLLFGCHPVSGGRYIGGKGNPSLVDLIGNGYWIYGPDDHVIARDETLPLDAVHPDLQRLFHLSFTEGFQVPSARPTPAQWALGLRAALTSLEECRQNPQHLYSPNCATCTWCSYAARTGVDLFPARTAVPRTLGSNPPSRGKSPSSVRVPVVAQGALSKPDRRIVVSVVAAAVIGTIILGVAVPPIGVLMLAVAGFTLFYLR